MASGTIYSASGTTQADLAIVATGNLAPSAISAGQYVIWNGSLYTAKTAIASGATLSTSNLTAVSNGGLNDLKAGVDSLNSKFESVQYNANTDRTAESNRTAAMDQLITNYFSRNYHFAIVRYSGGYYHGYIYIGEYNVTLIIEITHNISEKVIFWRKSSDDAGAWYKLSAIT